MARRKKKSPSAPGDDPLSFRGDDEARSKQHERNNIDTSKQSDTAISDKNIPDATVREDDSQGSVTIILDPVITLAEVSHLKESLLGYIGARQIQVDVSKVEHIDTAGLQLLLAFSKVFKKQGGKIIWLGWSAAYSNTAELLGLTAALGLEES